MRELNFKAFHKTEKWMDGVWLIDQEHELLCFTNHNQDDMENYELIMSTGLKDKNGKEIYEGDILQYNDYAFNLDPKQVHVGVVVWRDNNASFLCERVMVDGKAVKREYGLPGLQFKHVAEVIGNIYENPELLEMKR